MKALLTLALVTSLVACTWVKPSAGSDKVAMVKPELAASCKKVGEANASVKHRVGVVERREDKVSKELVTLAKNEAVKLGGNTIVQDGPAFEGVQRFLVYLCE